MSHNVIIGIHQLFAKGDSDQYIIAMFRRSSSCQSYRYIHHFTKVSNKTLFIKLTSLNTNKPYHNVFSHQQGQGEAPLRQQD